MKRLIIYTWLVLGITHLSGAQQDLVRYEEITFNSELEKTILDDHFLNKKSDHFLLLMASGNLLNESAVKTAKQRFYDQLARIGADNFDSKKNPKKVKLLYDELHKAFLSKYQLTNRFEEVFYNGYYNCVSASALFSLAFDNFKIPYTVKEKPTHVYLVAYPDTEKMIVETTTPVGGSVSINKNFQANFVRILKEQKIISAQEYNSSDPQSLFDKYFFGNQENIGLTQLVGIQYINEAIAKMDEEKYLEAFQNAEKGYLFYPCDRSNYLLMASAFEAFKRREKKDLVHASFLAKLARYKKIGITSDMIQGEFVSVVQALLFNAGEREKLTEYFNHLQSLVSDESLKKELSFIYQYENGRSLYNKARYKDCIPYFEAALEAKPRHEDASQILIASIAQVLQNKPNIEAIASLEQYSKKFPELMENNIFTEMLGSSYLTQVQISFETQKPVEGEKYRTIFEAFYKDHSDVSFDPYMVARAYSSAAVYYFKKSQTPKAKTILLKGLEISPNNYELKARQRMIH